MPRKQPTESQALQASPGAQKRKTTDLKRSGSTGLTIVCIPSNWQDFGWCGEAHSTTTISPAERPKVSGEYISSALAGGATNRPGVVASAT